MFSVCFFILEPIHNTSSDRDPGRRPLTRPPNCGRIVTRARGKPNAEIIPPKTRVSRIFQPCPRIHGPAPEAEFLCLLFRVYVSIPSSCTFCPAKHVPGILDWRGRLGMTEGVVKDTKAFRPTQEVYPEPGGTLGTQRRRAQQRGNNLPKTGPALITSRVSLFFFCFLLTPL